MNNLLVPQVDQELIEYNFPCIKAHQPIGDIYVATISHKTITKISFFDVRRLDNDERDIERYLGVQRPLNPKRVSDLKEYVTHFDASFPTSVIIAIESDYVSYDSSIKEMTVRNYMIGEEVPSISIGNLARIIDGQHRIAGLEGYQGTEFDLTVTIFVGADVADQAHIFATVNLEQTKVSKSLAYDLYELSKSRSPQKTCHNIAVALDRDVNSPFHKRIKRLGLATEGRFFEPITQATFVEALIVYISQDAKRDRDILLRGKRPEKVFGDNLSRTPLRNVFIDENDILIAQLFYNYFNAIKKRWPVGWENKGKGYILNRTNGFRAAMRAFGRIYLNFAAPGEMVSTELFKKWFENVQIYDEDFNVDNFPPGTSGEAKLYRVFMKDQDIRGFI